MQILAHHEKFTLLADCQVGVYFCCADDTEQGDLIFIPRVEETRVSLKSRHRRKIMMRTISLTKRSVVLGLLVFGVLLGAAWAQTETVLYSFCAQGGNSCTDGDQPVAGVVFDQAGNVYGTTQYGGAHGRGVVFKLTPKGKETVLYNFCAQSECTDGEYPYADLVFDQKGNLYGTTWSGGTHKNTRTCRSGCGVVFEVTPEGKEIVLYNFCAQSGCTDGANPSVGVVFDQKGNLYGTTILGGAYNNRFCYKGCGVVFKLSPDGRETVLYRFCAHNNCLDGASPNGVAFDQKGNLYGTTILGGVHEVCALGTVGCGVVFKLTPKGKETVLYSFCALGGENCGDGQFPNVGLVFDQKGNLYGTTEFGGVSGSGTVFKLTPTGQETVLHSFCSQNNCTDGAAPLRGPIIDQKGTLYGTAYFGGAYYGHCDDGGSACGVVFRITPKGKETVLYSFCPLIDCTDGADPQAKLVFDQKGNLYGTTQYGGAHNNGAVFKLTP
jgi:uncharacterized repeat protein (TIGR03803 family)